LTDIWCWVKSNNLFFWVALSKNFEYNHEHLGQARHLVFILLRDKTNKNSDDTIFFNELVSRYTGEIIIILELG
jgi:hypothetical protein